MGKKRRGRSPHAEIDLRSRYLKLADRFGLADATGNATAHMEARHTVSGLRVRIAKDRKRKPIEDAIALFEITERDREGVASNVAHIGCFDNRPTQQRRHRRG